MRRGAPRGWPAFLALTLAVAAAFLARPGLAQPAYRPTAAVGDEDPAGMPPFGPANGWSILAARPEAAGRLTKFFDFEEFTPNPVPNHWFRAQGRPSSPREGFPPTNLAELDEKVASSGKVSIKLPTRGGSTSLMLSPGVVPVFSGADYRVSAKVRTGGLNHARAVLTGRFLDASSKPIPGAERSIASPGYDGRWEDVSVLVPGEYDGAAFLQIELQLLQPRELAGAFGSAAPGKFVAMQQDFSGAAWFDDVAVVQLAKIELTCDEPTNVLVAPRTPVLRAAIRDLTGETLRGRVSVRDLSGREIDVIEKVLGAGRAELTITPKLNGLGWYRAAFEVMSGDRVVGAAWTEFVVLPPRGETRSLESLDTSRLGVALQPAPDGVEVATLSRLVSELGVGAASLPIWSRDLTRELVEERAKSLSPLVDRLTAEYRAVTFVLAEPPDGMVPAGGLQRADCWAVLAQDRKFWWPYLDQFLDRFGQRVRRWQVGESGSETSAWRKALDADLARLHAEAGQLIAGPIMGVGSCLEFNVPPAGVASNDHAGLVAARVSPESTSWGVGAAVRSWRAGLGDLSSQAELNLVMDRGGAALYGREAAVGDLCRKTIEAWIACSNPADRSNETSVHLTMEQPWVWSTGRRPRPMPTPEFAAWRALGEMLSDRAAIGEFPAAPGIRCIILAPSKSAPLSRGGALVLWNESASPEDANFEAHLGSGELWLVDHFGNRTRLQDPQGSDRQGGETFVRPGEELSGRARTEEPAATVRTRVPSTPVFIEGIDVELVRLIASFKLTPPFLPATTQRKDLLIQFENPWKTAITGEITIVEPLGGGISPDGLDRSWKIVPRVIRFALGPEEKASLPLSVAFGGLEEAGRRNFVYLMDLSAERRLKGIKFTTPVDIGLKNIKLDLVPSLSPTTSGPDAVVEVQVTNLGEIPLDVELTAFAPKRPRASTMVGGLQPGHQAVRRFVFPGAAKALKGQHVLVSVTDPEGGTRLNSSVVVP